MKPERKDNEAEVEALVFFPFLSSSYLRLLGSWSFLSYISFPFHHAVLPFILIFIAWLIRQHAIHDEQLRFQSLLRPTTSQNLLLKSEHLSAEDGNEQGPQNYWKMWELLS